MERSCLLRIGGSSYVQDASGASKREQRDNTLKKDCIVILGETHDKAHALHSLKIGQRAEDSFHLLQFTFTRVLTPTYISQVEETSSPYINIPQLSNFKPRVSATTGYRYSIATPSNLTYIITLSTYTYILNAGKFEKIETIILSFYHDIPLQLQKKKGLPNSSAQPTN